jgi:methionyl-tRNA formyltransferase
VPTLAALLAAGHRVLQVYSQPDRPAGRGRQLSPTPVARFAIDHNLPLTRTANLNAEPLLPADVLVVIAFGQKISRPIADAPRFGSINLHASRLPSYRGAAPINWAILNGDSVTGNSIIRLADRMDAGHVLAQSQLAIGDSDTAGDLHDRLAADGPPLMLQVLHDLALARATELAQDESLATTAPKLSRQSATIDWTHSARQVARRINGLSPWPGCRVKLLNAQDHQINTLTLLRAIPTPSQPSAPGRLLPDGTIATGDGVVTILQVQPANRTPMSLPDYRRGNPWEPGMRIESVV